jgi:hypothetical protein
MRHGPQGFVIGILALPKTQCPNQIPNSFFSVCVALALKLGHGALYDVYWRGVSSPCAVDPTPVILPPFN